MNIMERWVRLIFCFLLCLCIMATLGFWIHECTHDCGGEDCVICQAVLLLRKKLLTGEACLSVFGAVMTVILLAVFANDLPGFPSCDTPVHRKVKLTI